MLFLVRGALALSILVFVPGLLEQFEPLKVSVVRIAGLALLAATAASPRRRGSLLSGPARYLDLAVAGWLVAEALATLTSRAPWLSFFGEQQQREGLLTSLGLAGLYLGARAGTRGPRDAAAVLDAALAAAAVAAGYALLQAARLDPMPWVRSATYGGAVRPFGTLGHANLLGVVASALAAGALGLAALDRERRRFRLAVAALLGLITLITLSRGAWLGLAAGSLAAAWLVRGAGAQGPTRRTWVWVGAIALGAVAVAALAWGGLFLERLRELVSPTQGSAASRLEIWRSAWAMFVARPWLGQGPDAFGLVLPHYQTPGLWRFEWGSLAGHAHSIYLHTLATRGALGAAAALGWCAALLLCARSAWRRAESRPALASWGAAVAALAVSGAVGALGVSGSALLVVASGVVAGLATPRAAQPAHAPTRGSAARRKAGATRGWDPALVAGTLAALAAAAWSGVEIAASRATAQAQAGIAGAPSQVAQERGRSYVASALLAAHVARLLPYDDWGPRLEAQADQALADFVPDPDQALSQAEGAAREAMRRMPARAEGALRLASVLAARAVRGDARAGREWEPAFARAAAMAPMNSMLLLEWSRARLRLGRAVAALESARRAAVLYPTDALALSMVAAAHLTLDQRAEGLATLERALAADWHQDTLERDRTRELVRALRSPPPGGTEGATPATRGPGAARTPGAPRKPGAAPPAGALSPPAPR